MGLISDIKNDLDKGTLRLLSEYHGLLLKQARTLVSSPDEAEDLVFRTIERVLSKAETYDSSKSDLLTWMTAIMTNLHRDGHRRKLADAVTYCPNEALADAADESATDIVQANSDGEYVRRVVASLPPELREVIVLQYFAEQPVAKVARILAIPPGTVASRVHLAKKLLLKKLGPEFGKAKKPLAVLGAVLLFAGTLFGAYQTGLVDAIKAALAGVEEVEEVEKEEEVEKYEENGEQCDSSVQVVAGVPTSPQSADAASDERLNFTQENATPQTHATQTQEKPTMKLTQTFAAAALAVTATGPISGFAADHEDVEPGTRREMMVSKMTFDAAGGIVAADLVFGPDNGWTNRLLLAWGSQDAGGVLSNWEHVEQIGLVTAETNAWHKDFTAEQRCKRFFLSPCFSSSVDTPLEYVASTGAQYVDAGFKITSSDVIMTRFYCNGKGNASILGSRASATSANYMLFSTGSDLTIDFGTSSHRLTVGYASGTWYDAVMSGGYMAITNVATGDLVGENTKSGSSGESPGNCYLFWGSGSPPNSNPKFSGRIARFKAVRGEEVRADYWPCQRAGEVGFVDLRDGSFHGAAAGTFSAGPCADAATVPYVSMTETLQKVAPDLSDVSIVAGNQSFVCSWRLDSLGIGASHADVLLEWSRSLTSSKRRELLARDALGAGLVTIGGIEAGHRFYARIIVTNDVGQAVGSDVFQFKFPKAKDEPSGLGRSVALKGVDRAQGLDVAHRLAFGAAGSESVTSVLYRVYGPEDRGSHFIDWPFSERVCEVPPTTNEVVVPVPPGWNETAYAVRYLLADSGTPVFDAVLFDQSKRTYFDLGFVLQSGDEVLARVKATAGGNIFGSRNSSNNAFIGFVDSNGSCMLDYGTSYQVARCSLSSALYIWMDILVSKDIRSVTNAITGVELAKDVDKCTYSYTAPGNCYVAFASHGTGGSLGNNNTFAGSIASFKVIRNGSPLVDLVAHSDADGRGCFYDAVSKDCIYATSGGDPTFEPPPEAQVYWSAPVRVLRPQPAAPGLAIFIF